MASETGVLDIAPENVRVKERLHPGKIFLVDTAQGRIVDDEEVKEALAAAHPYAEWLAEHLVSIEDLPDAPELPLPSPRTIRQRQQMFGYTEEDLKIAHRARWRARGRSPWDRWATTRRWPCCPIGRGCSTTTSRSCSRR